MTEKKNMQGGVFTIDAINLVNQEGESVDIQGLVLSFVFTKVFTISLLQVISIS